MKRFDFVMLIPLYIVSIPSSLRGCLRLASKRSNILLKKNRVCSRNCKIINLAKDKNQSVLKGAMGEAWFMCCALKIHCWAGDDTIDHLCPKAWGFWMALESVANWEDMPKRNWWAFEDLFPPSFRWRVDSDVQGCFGRRCLWKSVSGVGVIGNIVMQCSNFPERTSSRLIKGSSVCMCQGDKAFPGRTSVADTPGFLHTVRLDKVRLVKW